MESERFETVAEILLLLLALLTSNGKRRSSVSYGCWSWSDKCRSRRGACRPADTLAQVDRASERCSNAAVQPPQVSIDGTGG